MDGWNAVRVRATVILVITDVDMPRMDGIELATLIKQDPRFELRARNDFVSYKDREEDRMRRPLKRARIITLPREVSTAMRRCYQAVVDLIGEAES